jgi:HD-like signal output (HDOD) protein
VHEAETSVLGFTHCDIGEWLCNRWNFPERLVRWIANHHDDISAESCRDVGVRVVRLADIVCNRLQIGDSGNTRPYLLDRRDYETIGLDDGREIDSILRALT